MKKNMKDVLKAFRLFDYNRDGNIQRHELKRLLDNYCFKVTDQQYDKWGLDRYISSVHRTVDPVLLNKRFDIHLYEIFE